MVLIICPSNSPGDAYMGPRFEFHRGVAFPLHHGGVFALKGSAPLSSVLLSWERGTSSTTSTVTECVKRVMVVYTRIFDLLHVLICCFTSTVSSWGNVGTARYLTALLLGKSPVCSLLVSRAHSFGQ